MKKNNVAFSETARGKRFLRSLELSKDFTHKHDTNSLLFSEVQIMVDRALQKGAGNALLDMYNLAFRKGYMQAQRDATRRTN